MAANAEVIAVAAAVAEAARLWKSFKAIADQVLGSNTAHSIDWAQVATSNAGALDGDGHISGKSYTPAEVSNMIGSLAAHETLWGQGHGGNVEKMTDPIV